MEPITTRLGTKIYKNSSMKRVVLGEKHPMRKEMAIKHIYTDKDANFFKIHLRADDFSINCCDISGNTKDMKAVFAWIRDLAKTYKGKSNVVLDRVLWGDGLDEMLAKRLSKIGLRK